jgi:spore coat protein CotH
MSMVNLSKDKPAELPWLISFDEFSSGRAYQGNTEITLRPAALGSTTAINEALALTLTKQAGQTTQAYTITQVSVNGGRAVPRMLVDPPDESWADNYGDGVLYKARADGSFDYQGDDPTDYTAAFNQINAKGSYDLEPVMKLLKFVAKSGDQKFGAELDSYLDVDSFAHYLALQTLLSNSDAMDGPGNNYYLWYNADTERFTVLSWDLNLSSSMSFGGAGQGQPGQNPTPGNQQRGNRQQGTAPQAGNAQPPNGFPGAGGKAGQGGKLSSRGSGALKTRFMANTKFAKLYQQAYTELYQELYASGKAETDLTKIVARAKAAGDTGAGPEAEHITQLLKQTSATSES